MEVYKNLLIFFIIIASLPVQSKGYQHSVLQDPEILEMSKQHSRKMIEDNSLLEVLLNHLDFEYLHQLDPSKVYRINEQTLEINVLDSSEVVIAAAPSITHNSTLISLAGGDILGRATTRTFCVSGGQTASIKGFMVSAQMTRDPSGGTRNGLITSNTAFNTTAEVNFRLTALSGGARNPGNRTIMETIHSGSCNGISDFQNIFSEWPPFRSEMVIDDTGSMSNELSGLKTALINFISTNNTDPKKQRDISYELISFKDSPTLKLSNTEDSLAAINAVNALFPSGGSDCPEESVGALNLALNRLTGDESSEGQIILVTDASPHGGIGDINNVIAQAQNIGVKVNVMLSSDCVSSTAAVSTTEITSSSILSARDVFKRIADETGGLYFFVPSASSEEYARILELIFETAIFGGDDIEPPKVTVNASPTILWPPNHEMTHIDVDVVVTDNQDSNPIIELVSVISTEPDDSQGDGNTDEDIQITEDGKVYVRSERSGTDSKRFYTITYKATDNSGNVGTGSVDVLVPHNN